MGKPETMSDGCSITERITDPSAPFVSLNAASGYVTKPHRKMSGVGSDQALTYRPSKRIVLSSCWLMSVPHAGMCAGRYWGARFSTRSGPLRKHQRI